MVARTFFLSLLLGLNIFNSSFMNIGTYSAGDCYAAYWLEKEPSKRYACYGQVKNRRARMFKVVIIHGNGGSTADSNWIPWLKQELEKKGIKVLAPTMPDNIQAKASVWLPYMKNELKCDEQTIIVGHSSGAVAAMRYAEQNKLLGSVLIGACYTDLGFESERISGYYDRPWLWDAIKKNQQWIMQLSSTDDPYIPIEQAHHICKHLNAEYYESTGLGHFMIAEIPGLISLILKKLEKRQLV